MVNLMENLEWGDKMFRGYKGYLLYSIIAVVLFLWTSYAIYIGNSGANPIILIFIILAAIILLIAYFCGRKKDNHK